MSLYAFTLLYSSNTKQIASCLTPVHVSPAFLLERVEGQTLEYFGVNFVRWLLFDGMDSDNQYKLLWQVW